MWMIILLTCWRRWRWWRGRRWGQRRRGRGRWTWVGGCCSEGPLQCRPLDQVGWEIELCAPAQRWENQTLKDTESSATMMMMERDAVSAQLMYQQSWQNINTKSQINVMQPELITSKCLQRQDISPNASRLAGPSSSSALSPQFPSRTQSAKMNFIFIFF